MTAPGPTAARMPTPGSRPGSLAMGGCSSDPTAGAELADGSGSGFSSVTHRLSVLLRSAAGRLVSPRCSQRAWSVVFAVFVLTRRGPTTPGTASSLRHRPDVRRARPAASLPSAGDSPREHRSGPSGRRERQRAGSAIFRPTSLTPMRSVPSTRPVTPQRLLPPIDARPRPAGSTPSPTPGDCRRSRRRACGTHPLRSTETVLRPSVVRSGAYGCRGRASRRQEARRSGWR